MRFGLPTGRTVGDIYAWGAAGSIAGTFLAGFYLIATMGTITIIWAIGAVLLLMAVFYRPRFWPLYAWGAVFVAVMTMGMSRAEWTQIAGEELALRPRADRQVIYEDETRYCLVQVKKISEDPDTRTFVQDRLIHSRIVMGDILDLQYYYTQLYAILTKALSGGKVRLSTLSIGGGGYVFPRYVERVWPGSRVDVVEIDPGVTEAAIQAFGLARDTTINTFTMDARNYVDDLIRQNSRGPETVKYDFIYEDALTDYSIPFQLVTKQFNDKIADILTDDGVYLIELIDTCESGLFLAGVVNTLRESFSCVRVVTDYGRLPAARRTFIILAAKYDIDLEPVLSQNKQIEKLWLLSESELQLLIDKTNGIILTDTYAPVENLLAPVVRADAAAEKAKKHMERARKLKEQRKWQESIAEYQKAAQVTPMTKIEAYNEVGVIYITLGDFVAAAEYLGKAIEFNERYGNRKNIPVSYLNLALVLKRLNRSSEAVGHLKKAIQGFREELVRNPDSVETLLRLGNALAESTEFTQASTVLEKALDLDPGRVESYHYLAALLKLQRRYDEAAAQLQKGIAYMSEKGKTHAAAGLRKALESLEKDRKD